MDLALEVEFTIPAFLRKKFCLRKQTIEINKYRKSNFIKRFLFEDEEMSVENISKTLDKEVVDFFTFLQLLACVCTTAFVLWWLSGFNRFFWVEFVLLYAKGFV